MMLHLVFITIISISIIFMAKIKYFDKKSEKNRERVKRHRDKKKLKLIYQNLVDAKKRKINDHHHDEENPANLIESGHDESNAESDRTFVDMLKNWAINNHISAKAINELLAILRFGGFNFLPRDSRTLMQTPKNLGIKNLTNGHIWYNGVIKCLENVPVNSISTITLDWNFDGLPVFKSSNLQFWPMLASIQGNVFDRRTTKFMPNVSIK